MNYPIKIRILGKGESILRVFFLLGVMVCFTCCRSATLSQEPVIIVLGAYSGVQEAYQKEIIPAFQDYWFKKTSEKEKAHRCAGS